MKQRSRLNAVESPAAMPYVWSLQMIGTGLITARAEQ